MISFQNVSKTYENNRSVLENVNLHIKKGEFFILVGPSGSGKTTTLKMLNRLIEPTTGNIFIHEKDIHDYNLQELRWNIGYVLQQIALFPNLTVAENIEIIPEMKKWSKEKRRKRTIELLEKVNLDPKKYLHRKPSQLSGGEQQRIGILRALATNPNIILMDEPFSALDPISKNQLQDLMKQIHKELETTIVFVTHDMDEALKLGDRICIMKDGKVIQCDTPNKIRYYPEDDFVGQFFTANKDLGLYLHTIKDMIHHELLNDNLVNGAPILDINDNVGQLLDKLLTVQEINVIENNQFIGSASHQTLLQFLSIKQKEEVRAQ